MSLFMTYYKNHCTDSTLLFPGMEYVLTELSKDNINMAVVSNKAYPLVKIILDELNLSHYFTHMYGGDSFSEKKPNPVAVNQIMQDLNIKPEEAVMVGDSDNDVIAGKNAGINTCFCTYGYSALFKSKADFTIDSPIQLIDIIRNR